MEISADLVKLVSPDLKLKALTSELPDLDFSKPFHVLDFVADIEKNLGVKLPDLHEEGSRRRSPTPTIPDFSFMKC